MSRKLLRVIASIALIAITGSSLIGSGSDRAGAALLVPLYSCGNPYEDNCHGIVGWEGGTAGAHTEIEVGYGTRYVDDSDATLSQRNEYFYASQEQGGYYEYQPLGLVQGGDIGWFAWLDIARESSSSFEIKVWPAFGPGYEVGESHVMAPYYIVMGTQLSGSSGADMDTEGGGIEWDHNLWKNSNGYWYYQDEDNPPSTVRPGPIFSEWYVLPSQSETGGVFVTDCCVTDSDPSKPARETPPTNEQTKRRAPQAPTGSPAISPTILDAPLGSSAFTTQDVENYVERSLNTSGGAGIIEYVDRSHRPTLTNVEFLTHKDLLARYVRIDSLGQADDTLLCYIEFSGVLAHRAHQSLREALVALRSMRYIMQPLEIS